MVTESRVYDRTGRPAINLQNSRDLDTTQPLKLLDWIPVFTRGTRYPDAGCHTSQM